MEDEDPNALGRAYNASIYLMLGVCYGAFGVVAFLIYRGVKKNADYRRAIAESGRPREPARPSPAGEQCP